MHFCHILKIQMHLKPKEEDLEMKMRLMNQQLEAPQVNSDAAPAPTPNELATPTIPEKTEK